MEEKNYDRYLGVVVMILSVFIFLYSFKYSTLNRSGTIPVGPRFYPQLLGIGLFISGLILLLKNMKYKIELPLAGIKANGKIVLFSALFIIVFEFLGYIISTLCLVFCLTYFMGYRKIFTAIVYTVLFTLSLYVIFYTVVRVPLPGGLIGHRFF